MISLVLPTFNAKEHLKLCISSLRKSLTGMNNIKDKLELIIIDDGCMDGTKEYLNGLLERKDRIDTNILYSYDNNGLSAALNRGVLESRGEYVFLLNDDIVFHPDWFSKLQFVENGLWCPQLIEPGILQVAHDLIEKDFGKTPEEFNYDAFVEFVDGMDKPETVKGCNQPFLMKRNLYLAIGGMDENFSHADTDFYSRMRTLGMNIVKTTHTYFYHFSGASMRKNFNAKELGIKNQEYWSIKWKNTS